MKTFPFLAITLTLSVMLYSTAQAEDLTGNATSTTNMSDSEINVISDVDNTKIYASDGGDVAVGSVDVASGVRITGSKITVISDVKNTEIYSTGDSQVSVGSVRIR